MSWSLFLIVVEIEEPREQTPVLKDQEELWSFLEWCNFLSSWFNSFHTLCYFLVLFDPLNPLSCLEELPVPLSLFAFISRLCRCHLQQSSSQRTTLLFDMYHCMICFSCHTLLRVENEMTIQTRERKAFLPADALWSELKGSKQINNEWKEVWSFHEREDLRIEGDVEFIELNSSYFKREKSQRQEKRKYYVDRGKVWSPHVILFLLSVQKRVHRRVTWLVVG